MEHFPELPPRGLDQRYLGTQWTELWLSLCGSLLGTLLRGLLIWEALCHSEHTLPGRVPLPVSPVQQPPDGSSCWVSEHKESIDYLERKEGCQPDGAQPVGRGRSCQGKGQVRRGKSHPGCPSGRLGAVAAGPCGPHGVFLGPSHDLRSSK